MSIKDQLCFFLLASAIGANIEEIWKGDDLLSIMAGGLDACIYWVAKDQKQKTPVPLSGGIIPPAGVWRREARVSAVPNRTIPTIWEWECMGSFQRGKRVHVQ